MAYLLMELSPSLETANCAATQELPSIFSKNQSMSEGGERLGDEPFATFPCELASLDSPLRATSSRLSFLSCLVLSVMFGHVASPPSPSLSLFLPQFLTACTRSFFSGKPSREVVGLPPLPNSIFGHFV
jgi:hypothetical protein